MKRLDRMGWDHGSEVEWLSTIGFYAQSHKIKLNKTLDVPKHGLVLRTI